MEGTHQRPSWGWGGGGARSGGQPEVLEDGLGGGGTKDYGDGAVGPAGGTAGEG